MISNKYPLSQYIIIYRHTIANKIIKKFIKRYNSNRFTDLIITIGVMTDTITGDQI